MPRRPDPSGRSIIAAVSLTLALQAALTNPVSAAGGPCGGCFAVVQGSGSVVSSLPPLVTVIKRGIGRYEVNFPNGAVDGCAYSATLRNRGNFTGGTGSLTAGRPDSAAVFTVVNVATFDAAGKPADRGFHLVITC